MVLGRPLKKLDSDRRLHADADLLPLKAYPLAAQEDDDPQYIKNEDRHAPEDVIDLRY